jgi:PAS domain S-box-containing protein
MSKRFVNPSLFSPWCLVFLISLTWRLCVPALAQAPAQSALDAKGSLSSGTGMSTATALSDLTSKKVLILHSFAYAQPAYKIIDAALIESFVTSGLDFNNLYFEFLDLARNPGQEYRHELVENFRHKFKGRKLDLVLALHQEALQFLLKEGEDVYPEGPIISILGDVTFLEHSDLKRPIIHLPFTFDVISTAKEIFSLRPDTRKIFVIAGNSALDRRFEDVVMTRLKAWKQELDVESIPPLPLAEILKKVANLPTGTAILYTTVYADSTGKTYIPADVGRMISKAANAPVFGLFETLLGDNGIVGGIILNHRIEGKRAVQLAMEIIHGKLPHKPLTILPAPLVPMFDWLQLKRWGFRESALPANAIILNRPATSWERYKFYIIAALAFCLLETTLIIFLILQRSRRGVAEKALKHKTEELDQFFNVSMDLLCIANTDGYFLRLNPVWERILGYSREELMAKRFLDLVHPDDSLRTQEAVSAQVSGQRVIDFENRYRCKDGTYRWLEWSSVPAGNLIYSAARDITERKQAEAEVSRARRELLRVERSSRLSEMTASLAHELNQPLAAILSNAQAALRFLKSDKPDLNEFREIMQDIISDDQRAGNVIRSLRSMMKREEGEKRPIILNDVLNDVIQIFRSEAIFRNVRIETELDGSLPPIPGDKGQLQQVVLNIIMNGSEAMSGTPPEQRKLILRTQRKDHSIWVTARDFGPGIDKGDLDRIFQPFFTTKGTGLGMGLAVCRTIVEAHGGRILAENNSDGGTTFFIELPICESSNERMTSKE